MADQERVINVRIMRGVDLQASARLVDPGTYRRTTNLWAKQRGILELRPGSTVFASNVVVFPAAAKFLDTLPADVLSKLSYPLAAIHSVNWKTAALQRPGPFSRVAATFTGGDAISPAAIPEVSLIPTGINGKLGNNGFWVEALERVMIPYSGKTVLFGAMSGASNDFLFWVDEDNASAITPIPTTLDATGATVANLVNSSDGMWQMIPIHSAAMDDQQNQAAATNNLQFMIVCLNGVDKPLAIRSAYTANNTPSVGKFGVTALDITATITAGTKVLHMTGPTCGTMYGTQFVWGGAKFCEGATAGVVRKRLDNYLVMSDPVDPNTALNTNNSISHLAQDTDGSLFTLQVGDSVDEAVVAVVGSPTITDANGPISQLVAFTALKTMVFTGPLPSTGNPKPDGFGLAADGDIGTQSPKTVVRTKYGTVFLGSDGLVRIVALNNRIEIIGRALEPLLGGQSMHYYSRCCAYYKDGFYHLFFPFTISNGIQSPQGINQFEYVADLRHLTLGDPRDQGVEWFGPWTGRFVSCVKVSRAPLDNFTVFAGLGHRPVILKLEQGFTDPAMDTFVQQGIGGGVPYNWLIETGPLDLGDMHSDKKINAFSIGLALQDKQSVRGTIAVIGDGLRGAVATGMAGYSKVVSVTPNSPGLDGLFTLSSSGLTDITNPALPTWQPSSPMRGRAFIVTFEGTRSNLSGSFASAVCQLSDFQFRLVETLRRATASY